jgi:glucosamine--fructose-6-phosphate aminotransferase (isomerizing)
MCGIVGAVGNRDVVPFLMQGLKHLEYRGYDSAGVAVLKEPSGFELEKIVGKVSILQALLAQKRISGLTGIAHTRWATHGKPTQRNAHPHMAGNRVILVHNGIIENHELLRNGLKNKGYDFLSDTDSELIAYSIYDKLKEGKDFLSSVRDTVAELEGSYAICVMDTHQPKRIVGVRFGPPLIIGMGDTGYFFASDILTLQSVAKKVIYLEDGDIADMSTEGVIIYGKSNEVIDREIHAPIFTEGEIDKAGYSHFMLKEIFEQPHAILNSLNERLFQDHVLEQSFGTDASHIFDKTHRIQIIACGTSYYAGLVGRLWLESIANIPCQVEIASEFRYRKRAKEDPNTLLICISQSGETADTIGALRSIASDAYCGTLAVCNVPYSSLVRESTLSFMTNAGPEIGVCSTKSFTTQLVALFLLSLVIGRRRGLTREQEKAFVLALRELPCQIQDTLLLSSKIQKLAELCAKKSNAIFLGRGLQYPVSQEGALKLKEISYIHAEAYPAGELKHGPLALIDESMPIIVLAPNDSLLKKIKSNIQEIQARNGELIIFAAKSSKIEASQFLHVLEIPEINENLTPFVYTIPLQLFAYYVALLKGTDVDQPRNLAKSVTVE